MSGGKRAALLATVALVGFSVPHLRADAQPAGGTPTLSFDIGETVSSHSNYNLTNAGARGANTLDTNVGLSYNTATRLQSLRFSLSGLLRASSNPAQTQSGLRQPQLNFNYRRATRDAKLSFGASYTRQRANDSTAFLTLPDGSQTPVPLVSGGTVSNSAAQFNFETGLRAPIGFSLNATATNQLYSGSTGVDAYNTRKRTASAMVKLHQNRTTEFDLGVTYSRERDENILGTRRTDTGAYLGVLTQTRGMTFTGVFGYMRSRSDFTSLLAPQSSSGPYGSVGIVRKTSTGDVLATLESTRDSLGLRNTLSFGGDTRFHDGSQLSAKVGVSARVGGGPQAVGTISYAGKLRDGSYELALDRSIALNANNVDVAYTQLSANYTRNITELSSFGVDVSLARTSAAGYGSYITNNRQTVTLSYNHDLTKDWKLSTGVELRRGAIGNGVATDNSAFLSIKRRFTLLP